MPFRGPLASPRRASRIGAAELGPLLGLHDELPYGDLSSSREKALRYEIAQESAARDGDCERQHDYEHQSNGPGCHPDWRRRDREEPADPDREAGVGAEERGYRRGCITTQSRGCKYRRGEIGASGAHGQGFVVTRDLERLSPFFESCSGTAERPADIGGELRDPDA